MSFPYNIGYLAHILSTLNEFSCSRYASGVHEKSCLYDNEHFITLKIPYIIREWGISSSLKGLSLNRVIFEK